MILVISENTDYTTKLILEWLDHQGKEFLRLNLEDKITITNISYGENSDATFNILGRDILSSSIKSVWFRRGFMRVNDFLHYKVSLRDIDSIEKGMKYYLSAHSNARQEIIECNIHQENKNAIGRNGLGRINKSNVLKIAEKLGLNIPSTILTTKKNELLKFQSEHEQGIITKSIDVNFYASEKTEKEILSFNQYTAEITAEDIADFPEIFNLTTFQEKLEKSYEICSFFWNKKYYSQALFTQTNEKTKLDSRDYDDENKTRSLPINLPNHLEVKIKRLMKTLDLETGSLDFVKTKNGKFVFLEVNPRGQFGYLSKSSNYNLEKIIAENL
jgi:ATP-GRASP peptide maturase of grasp-with-spasm system